jgi:hypothetical protein
MGLAGAIIGGVATVAGGVIASSGASKAANAQVDAANASNATQLQMFNQQRQDSAPWRSVGQNALYKLAGMYGVDAGVPADTAQQPGQQTWTYDPSTGGFSAYTPPPAPAQPKSSDPYGGFTASPGYQFRLNEGMKAIERSAAARGGLRSGATMKSLNDYAQGTASSEFGNYTNTLANLAGIGQTVNAQNAAAGQNYANQTSANNMAAGNARASAYTSGANTINQGIGNLASAYLYTKGYGGGFGGGSSGPIAMSGTWA